VSDSRKQKAAERTRLLGEAPVRSVLIRLAVPSIAAMVSNALYNVVDAAFIGRLGTAAIGAVAVAFPIMQVIVGVGLAFGIGSASYISRSLGGGNKEEADRTASTTVLVAAGLGVILAAAGLRYLAPVLRIFGATSTILPFAHDYVRVIIFAAPAIMARMTLNNIVRAEGNARLSMIAMMTGAALNIGLDPLFIFTFNMGIVGAAVATVISQVVSIIIMLVYLLGGFSFVTLRIRLFTLKGWLFREVLKIGTPTFIRQILTSIAVALLNNVASRWGDAAVASVGLSFRILFLGMFPVFGFGQAFQPVAGYNYGARNFNRLFATIREGFLWTASFTVIFTVVIQILATPIVSIFTTDPRVISIASRNVRAFHLLFPFFGPVVICNVLFQALGRGVPAAILSLSRQGIFLVPAIIILPHLFGLDGVFFTQAFADFFTILITAFFAWRVLRDLRQEALHQEGGLSG